MNKAEALALYDKRAWCIIPIAAGDKRPALSEWTTYQQRRSTPAEWELWWPEGAEPRIGVVTGSVSGGLVVLDCDDMATHHRLCQAMPELRSSLTVKTGKGMHVYIQPVELVASATFTLNGKVHHIQSEGKQVVAPPTIHPNGRTYQFVNPEAVPAIIQPVDLRTALEAIGAAKVEPKARPAGEQGWVAEALAHPPTEGGRDEMLNHLAGYFNGRLPWDVTEEVLSAYAERMDPPLSRAYVQDKIRSVSRYDRRFCPECGRIMPSRT